MRLWPLDAIEGMQNEEDKLFLQAMMADRVATLGPFGNVLAITGKEIPGRRNREEAQRKKEAKRRKEEQKCVLGTFLCILNIDPCTCV